MLDAIDIVLIHQLIGRYGHLIDHRRWDRFGELFLPDATIDYRGGTGHVERRGRDAIVDWFRELDDTHPAAHHVTNIAVDDSADPTARVDVYSKFLAPFTRDRHMPKRTLRRRLPRRGRDDPRRLALRPQAVHPDVAAGGRRRRRRTRTPRHLLSRRAAIPYASIRTGS